MNCLLTVDVKETATISWQPINVSRHVVEPCQACVSNLWETVNHDVSAKSGKVIFIKKFLVLVPECENVSCPNANKRYLDRGCRPEYKGKACCPTSFTCRKLLPYSDVNDLWLLTTSCCGMIPAEDKAKVGVCHYGGVTYKLGERVAAVSQDHPCKTDCHCVSSSEQYVNSFLTFLTHF